MKSIDEVNLVDFVCLTSHCKCNSKCDDCSECESEIDMWLAKHDSELLDEFVEKCREYEDLTFDKYQIERIEIIADELKVGDTNAIF